MREGNPDPTTGRTHRRSPPPTSISIRMGGDRAAVDSDDDKYGASRRWSWLRWWSSSSTDAVAPLNRHKSASSFSSTPSLASSSATLGGSSSSSSTSSPFASSTSTPTSLSAMLRSGRRRWRSSMTSAPTLDLLKPFVATRRRQRCSMCMASLALLALLIYATLLFVIRVGIPQWTRQVAMVRSYLRPTPPVYPVLSALTGLEGDDETLSGGYTPGAHDLVKTATDLASPLARRPCAVHIEQSMHWRGPDRYVWPAVAPPALIEDERKLWQDFLRHDVPHIDYSAFPFHGRGVVYTAGSFTLPRALLSIRLLRKHGCRLPIQLWYVGEELSAAEVESIVEIGAEPRDLLVEQKRYPMLAKYEVKLEYARHRNYHIKTMALLLSRFQQVLYLDSDNMPLRDPTFLFESQAFTATGALFWPDFWKMPIDQPMWSVMGVQCEDEMEQESGQLVIDKERAWHPLLLSMFLQMRHHFYFKIILGDKDTFRFAWKATTTPYHMVRHPIAIAGRVRESEMCGHTMVQHDPDEGRFLFAHASALKSTHDVRRGRTWEAIQYLERVEPMPVSPISDAAAKAGRKVLSFRVGYPVAHEYAGGVWKREIDGGIGEEAAENACILYALVRNTTIETTPAVVKAWGSDAVDSYRVVTEDLSTYQNGALAWLDDTFFDMNGPVVPMKREPRPWWKFW